MSESRPAPGFILGVSIDFTTVGLGAFGALLCVLGFHAGKNHPQQR